MNIKDEAVVAFRAEAKECTDRELSAELVRRCLTAALLGQWERAQQEKEHRE